MKCSRPVPDHGAILSPREQPSRSTGKGRILIAEDSPTQARQLEYILEGEGYDVTVAPDGAKGFDIFKQADCDLVISDVVMPGLTGYELCRKIKADPIG